MLAARLRASGIAAETMVLNVSDAAQVSALSRRLADVDIVLNNAGIACEQLAVDQSEADWDFRRRGTARRIFLRSGGTCLETNCRHRIAPGQG
jgi:hypothetical protein